MAITTWTADRTVVEDAVNKIDDGRDHEILTGLLGTKWIRLFLDVFHVREC
jgi:hypothetical protein